jgi:hypothetical protein
LARSRSCWEIQDLSRRIASKLLRAIAIRTPIEKRLVPPKDYKTVDKSAM